MGLDPLLYVIGLGDGTGEGGGWARSSALRDARRRAGDGRMGGTSKISGAVSLPTENDRRSSSVSCVRRRMLRRQRHHDVRLRAFVVVVRERRPTMGREARPGSR